MKNEMTRLQRRRAALLAEAAAARAARTPIGPRIRTIRPTATTRYYILENRETGERETDRSFETERAAIQYVLRNYGEAAR